VCRSGTGEIFYLFYLEMLLRGFTTVRDTGTSMMFSRSRWMKLGEKTE